MLYKVAVSLVSCLEDGFLHTGWNILHAAAGLPQDHHGLWSATSLKQDLTWGVPITIDHHISCCPTSQVKKKIIITNSISFPRSQYKTKVDHDKENKTQNLNLIYPLFLPKEIHCRCINGIFLLDFHSESIYSKAFFQVLSHSLFDLILSIALWRRLAPFSRWRHLDAYVSHPKPLKYPVAESNLNPGVLTLNLVLLLPPPSCSQATRSHSLPPLQT